MEDLEYIELFELYKGLLTKTQQDMFSSHLCLDLSLGEVAEEFNTSRQNVNDTIKKVKIKLSEYENSLHLKKKNDLLNKLYIETEDEEIKKSIKGILDI